MGSFSGRGRGTRVLLGIAALGGVVALSGTTGGSLVAQGQGDNDSRQAWRELAGGAPARAANGAEPAVHPRSYRAFDFERGSLRAILSAAPLERTRASRERPLVISLPGPDGAFHRFAVAESPVMEPGLAARHPEIKTYAGRGIDTRGESVRFSLTPLGFQASVRSPKGNWYIDPYYHHDQSVYVSYFTRDLPRPATRFVERGGMADLSVDRGYSRADQTVELRGSNFAANTPVSISIADDSGAISPRALSAVTDDQGSFTVTFVADASGALGTRVVEASDGAATSTVTYDVVAEGNAPDAPVGPQLRTYRLALLTDPGYATYFGAANVTAAKVALINRVTQVYEYDTSIRLTLIATNDNLNLNTAAQMTGANGPCGGTACYTSAQSTSCTGSTLTRTRQVIGLLVGASNFDIGHIALGQPGGGVASLGVVGGNNKAQGCTGLTTPVGDFFAVDYVAHEMGHQYAGNHTFNGTVSNCSGGNRSAANSVEPGSGSSVMAYAGICGSDNLQPHSDPYWSYRSFDEITTYTSNAETNINEVQMAALTGFDTNGDSFQIQYNGNDSAAIVRGTNYTAAGVQAAIQGISGWPAGATAAVSALGDTAFTVTFGGTLAATDVSLLQIVNPVGLTGYISDIAKGGLTTRQGTTSATGNNYPIATAPAGYFIPLRTPFALTGSAVDPDGDPLTYMWEQSDRGGSTGTGLVNNTKTNGPLFRQFGVAAIVSPSDTLLYDSPGENHTDGNPTRVFPDMLQILANNTNAETGACPANNVDCFSEFLPTSAYVGFGGNASPARLNFRFTARDGKGGVNTATTTLTLATAAGPFLVTSPNTSVTLPGGTIQTVTWNVAGTDLAPVSAAAVKISVSVDGGLTFPYVLKSSTPNDGSEAVTLPNLTTTQARVKIEAVGNVFFDVSNSNFTITATSAAADARLSGAISASSPTSLTVAITNIGTGPAHNVQLNQLIFRTLAGAGTVTTTTPTPIALGSITVGETKLVTIAISRPAGVTRFTITELGSLFDAGGVRNFSLSQVVQ